MIDHAGELAALATAVLWAATSIAFARAGQRIGSMVVNGVRLVIAFPLLCAAGWAWRGQLLPLDATSHQWMWLSISGFVGFVLGDMCLLRALVVLGPRLSSLVMAATPILTAILGWLALGESMSVAAIGAMLVTVAGIGWAIAGRQRVTISVGGGRLWVGVLLALGGALGQAAGLVLSKHGMGDYSALAATQVRLVAALVGWLVVFTALGWWPRVVAGLRDAVGLGYVVIGAVLGPFVGVTLSLVAVQYTYTGVAASIMATAPIVIIPMTMWLDRERVGVAGFGGAVLAVCGVVLLFAT